MKLSEAIMLGMSEIYPTNSCWYFVRGSVRDEELNFPADKDCAGCLVGAALYAVGSKVGNNDAIADLRARWPWLKYLVLDQSVRSYTLQAFTKYGIVAGFLTSLMHSYKMKTRTLEEICDIIRGLEAKYDVAKEPEPVEVTAAEEVRA